MSRSYAIRIPIEVLLSHSLRDKLGGFKINFPLLDILPHAEMLELVKKRLLDAGFTETADGLAMAVNDGQQAIFNPDSMEMKLSIALPGDQTVRVYEEILTQVEGRIRKAVETGGTVADEFGNNLDQAMARQLTDLAILARNQVNAVLKEVYRDAIKEKAGQLGSVSNISESSEGNVYRIRVEINQ